MWPQENINVQLDTKSSNTVFIFFVCMKMFSTEQELNVTKSEYSHWAAVSLQPYRYSTSEMIEKE